ncbi:hypothetical protein AAVH_25383 [Aphelenchoides avenae]|nr:hypothetical protein AAVH_25383 [Aphelenchus avenae]
MNDSKPKVRADEEAAAAEKLTRLKFDKAFNPQVVEYAKRHKTKDGKTNKDGTAKRFGIHRKTNKNKKCKRLWGGGRRLKLKQFDQDVDEWLKQAREKKLPVTRTLIFQEPAKKLQAYPAGPDGRPVLELSVGWMEKSCDATT